MDHVGAVAKAGGLRKGGGVGARKDDNTPFGPNGPRGKTPFGLYGLYMLYDNISAL